ncbi:MAG: insulinase family protein [Ruminococcaceae bacterium]|nr:insulinase family protein [Oscillospiraceae bacterium]
MINTVKINDNISLSYIPMEKLKTTTIGMYIHRPLKREEASKNAILPHILKNGCKKCKNATEIAQYLDNLYGAKFSAGISKKGEDHMICFDFETISDKYAANGENLVSEVVDFMLAVVFDTLDEFDETTFEVERVNSINKIKSIINDKRIYANYRCQEEMCRGDAFEVPRLGYVEDMEKLTKEELHSYYEEVVRGSMIDIFICGDADVEALACQIKEKVRGIEFTDAKMPLSNIIKRNREVNKVTEKLNVTQGKLCIGFLTDTGFSDSDYFSMVVANSVFGDGAQSKLFNNVREKLSLAYYAGSMLDSYKGFLMVNAGIEFENFTKAYDEILVQLDEMKKGNITDEEFEASKGFLINSYTASYDDQSALISFHLGGRIRGINHSIEDCINSIKNVKKEDVVKVMQKVHLDTVYFLEGLGE